ncbi:MAG: hypothetical protein P1P83_10435 [Bacteroidales bacterium]|nr:hypothetical protein [Bacteroidales bacterium]MDT8374406.1 hypothetical protein [Bacteroidales bacterium]
MRILHYIAMGFFLLGTFNLAGQEVIQKASATIEKSYGKGIVGVVVYGEKASVKVQGWNGSEVKVLFRPVSRNRDREQAIADLKYIHYSAEREGDKLVVSNSFRGKHEQISSNLTIEIEIFMPHSVAAEITNLYGPVEITNLTSARATVSFGSLRVSNISSECRITTRYSDMELNSVRGILIVNSEKSDILTTDLTASTTINCSYGEAYLGLAGAGPFIVKGHRTEVGVTVEDFENYRYILKAMQGIINLPGGRQVRNELVEKSHESSAGLIDVSTSYCDITILTN